MNEQVRIFIERYRQEMEAKLEGVDPVEVLRMDLQEVTALVASVDEERFYQAPGSKEWSPHQVLMHLADTEAVYSVHVRLILTEERPTLVGYDSDAWIARCGNLEPNVQETLTRWQALRRSNLRLYDSLNSMEWERIGLHTERGEETVRMIVTLLAGHARSHREQIRHTLDIGQ